MAELIIGSYPVFLDIDGTPLDDGFLFVGEPDLDPIANPLQAYWDEALTVPASNIRTKSGYPFNGTYPARLYIGEAYSLLVKNKREITVYAQQNSVADPSSTNISWTAGTTAGPICNSSTGTDEAIPSAGAGASGAITTGAQTLAGIKTFDSIPVVPDNPVTDSNTGAVTGNNVFDYVGGYSEPLSIYSVSDIVDGTDVTINLPTAVGAIAERTYKRRGAGTGVVLFTTVSSQTIDGLAPTQFELRGEVEITLFSNAGNWEQKSLVKDWVAIYDQPANATQTIILAVIDGKYKLSMLNTSNKQYGASFEIDTAQLTTAVDFNGGYSINLQATYTKASDLWDTTLGTVYVKKIERWQDRVKLAGL